MFTSSSSYLLKSNRNSIQLKSLYNLPKLMDFIINIIMAFTSPVAAVSPDASAVVHMATVSAIMQLIALRTCGCCVYTPPSITIIFINQFIFTQNEMHTGPLKLQSQNKSESVLNSSFEYPNEYCYVRHLQRDCPWST